MDGQDFDVFLAMFGEVAKNNEDRLLYHCLVQVTGGKCRDELSVAICTQMGAFISNNCKHQHGTAFPLLPNMAAMYSYIIQSHMKSSQVFIQHFRAVYHLFSL
jgi:hypothetical protein